MERTSPPQMKLPLPVNSFGSCASCGLMLCSATRPQLLPCLHSLCKDCVFLTGDVKECPICQEKCELQDLISNLLFADLSSNPKDVKCQRCEDPSVTGWCVECQENFCTGCVVAHKKVKLAQKHYIHTITPECPRPVFCTVHKNHLIYSYCLTCDKLICKLCQPLHPMHLLQYAHEVVDKQKKQIQRMVQKAQQQRLTVQKNLTDLDVRLSDLEQLQAQVRLEVKETVVRLCNVMVKKAAKLNKEIKDLCGKEREKLAERRSLLQKLKEKLDHVLTFTDKTLASHQHMVLLSCKRQIHHQLQGMLDQVVSPIPTVMDLSFHTNESHVKKVLKVFGRVVTREVPFACSSTGNIANPSPDLTLNCSLSVSKAAFQTPTTLNATSHSSPPSVSLPQQSPPSSKQHPVLNCLFSKKASSHSKHDSFSLSQNNKYSNYPGLKRAWSYHPYYPKDAFQPVKSSVKTVSSQNRRKELVISSRANSPKRASSSLYTSGPVASMPVQKTVSPPIFTDCSSAQVYHKQNGKDHQNNLDLVRPPRQQATNPSPPVVPTTSLSKLRSYSQKNKNKKVEATFTVPDAPMRSLLVSQGTIPSQLHRAEDRLSSVQTVDVGQTPKEPTFHHVESSKGFRGDLQTNKLVRNDPVSATVAAVDCCSVEAPNPENVSISRRVKGYHCNQSEVGSTKRTHPCTLEHEEKSIEHNLMTIKVKTNGLPLQTIHTATQTKPLVEGSRAAANVKDSHSFLLKEEDDQDEKNFTIIRDDQDNLAVLETLGRNWLPDVLVTRLPLPDFSSPSSTPALCFLWEEERKSFQLCSIKEDDQCAALAPITSNASRPLLVKKLHCAACRIKGKLFQCSVCKRAFHGECHLPPVSVNSGEQWQCTLCSDLSHTEDLNLSGGSPCLNVNGQRKCEYLLLYLSCNKQSSMLYRPAMLSTQTSRYVDMTLIRGRLLKKLTPYYLTPGEFVSDVWLLLHTLLNSAKEPQHVMRLQRSFSKELMRVFGQSLHPSLLNDPFTGQQEEWGNRKTDV